MKVSVLNQKRFSGVTQITILGNVGHMVSVVVTQLCLCPSQGQCTSGRAGASPSTTVREFVLHTVFMYPETVLVFSSFTTILKREEIIS